MKPGPRQAIVAGALLLAALLAAAAGTAATAKGSKSSRSTAAKKAAPPRDTSQVLVRIGDQAITTADVQKRLEEIPEQARATFTTPDGRKQLLDRIIEERVWLMTATQAGVADRAKVQQQLEQQKRDLLIRTYLNEVMAANPAPSDSEAKAWYDAHVADYRIPASATIRHIQTRTEADAKNVLKQARAGQDWNKLVQKYSTDTLTRAGGGLLGTVTPDGLFPGLGKQPALAESAFAVGAGKVGGPVKTDKGWHVIKVDEIKAEGVRPFESVRPMILRQLGSQRTQDFYQQQLREAKDKLKVVPDSAAIKDFVAQKRDAREMFRAAQEIGPPTDRIAAYRQLLEQHPDSDVAPQAQFMIGFIYSEELKNYDEAEKAFREVLQRYPSSELATSAQWMVEHMRSEEAPDFNPLETDSSANAPQLQGKGSSGNK